MNFIEMTREKDCIPVNFFNKLPPKIKAEIDQYTLHRFSDEVKQLMIKDYYMIDYIFTMTPEKSAKIMNYGDDFEYFTMIDLWKAIQPVYRRFFEDTDYYQRYPEYLV